MKGEKVTPEHVHHVVSETLGDLEGLFIEGIVLTFIAAHPDNPDGHMVISTAADLDVVINTLQETIESRKGAV